MKKNDNAHICYICKTKKLQLQIQHILREPKKTNLGVNSVN
jgi:hypothetical protein